MPIRMFTRPGCEWCVDARDALRGAGYNVLEWDVTAGGDQPFRRGLIQQRLLDAYPDGRRWRWLNDSDLPSTRSWVGGNADVDALPQFFVEDVDGVDLGPRYRYMCGYGDAMRYAGRVAAPATTARYYNYDGSYGTAPVSFVEALPAVERVYYPPITRYYDGARTPAAEYTTDVATPAARTITARSSVLPYSYNPILTSYVPPLSSVPHGEVVYCTPPEVVPVTDAEVSRTLARARAQARSTTGRLVQQRTIHHPPRRARAASAGVVPISTRCGY